MKSPSSLKGKKVVVKGIEDCQLDKHAQNLQGIFVNLDIDTMDIALLKLKATDFSKRLISNGLVFVWTDKRRISELIEVMKEKDFKYVENIVFSVFDSKKLSKMLSKIVDKKQRQKGRMESYFDNREGEEEELDFDWEETMELLLKAPFSFEEDDSIANYFLKFKSEFISTNKRTLLVFRRVG